MIMIKIHTYTAVALTLILVAFYGSLQAQEATATKKATTVNFQSIVADEDGRPIPHATVTTSEGSFSIKTAEDGSFVAPAPDHSKALIEAPGYEDEIIVIQNHAFPKEIILKKAVLYGGGDMVALPAGIQNPKRSIVGAVSSIKGEALSAYPDVMLSNMLQGKLLGLSASMNAGGLANNPSTLSVRGNQRGGNNMMVVIVDGMERSLDDLIPEEIESIEVLKDATAKILYGPRAANGVLLITTKHGEKLKRVIRTSVESGYGLVTRTPKYLNSYDYAILYNQARQRNGLAPLYSAADIDGYKNNTGANDFRYPDVDFSDYFLNDYNNYHRITTRFSGGDEKTQYAFIAGYTGTNGLEKVGIKPQYNRLNLRGNLDIKVSDIISGFIGLAGQFDLTKRGPINYGAVYNAVSGTRPNEYPLIIGKEIMPPDSLGIPALGASLEHPENLYGMLTYGGYAKDQNVNGQTNFGLKFDLSNYVKGLSAKAYYTFDNSFYGQESLNTTASTYMRRYFRNEQGRDSLILVQLTRTNINDELILSNTFNRSSRGVITNLNYNNQVGQHALNIDFSNLYLKQEITGADQDVKTANHVLRGNYGYNNRYIIEGSLSYMGSSKFMEGKRYQLFYAGGLAWIMSEESFFNADKINFLKVKASAGLLGYDGSTEYHLFQNRWFNNGGYRFNNGNNPGKIQYNMIGNPDLDWEKSRQINVGFETMTFDRRFFVEANYFNELSFDQIQKVNQLYSSTYGGLFPSMNWGKVANQGVEVELRWSDRTMGGLEFAFGGNLLYSKNKILQTDEVNYPYDYLKMTTKPSDAMFGYVTEGIFGKNADLEGHAPQVFGPYGNGDIAYKDLNNDGIINELDRKMLGNALPRVVLGLDLNLKYKRWELYALGTANFGVHAWLNNSYYWISGEGKYSVKALEYYHETNNPTGIYPSLTTTTGSNNLINSDMWMENSGFFRLKNVELSCVIFERATSSFTKSVKLFSRGANLLVLSKIKDLDPEALNAGVSNYPILRNITGGVSMSF